MKILVAVGSVTGLSASEANTLNQMKLKGSYLYRAKLAGSVGYFKTTGSSDSTAYPGLQDDGTGGMTAIPISGSAANNPDTRGSIPQLFWSPVQNVRVRLAMPNNVNSCAVFFANPR